MVKIFRYLATAVALLVATGVSALTDTANGIFREDIRTLQVKVNGRIDAMPVVLMDGGGTLTVEFDQLADDREYLRYSLTHCDATWQPSNIVESEYLDGFNEATVDDYEYSRATTVHYVHYRIQLPNDQMMPLISGNYLLKVYPENDPDDVWLQCRFMVCEGTARVTADVSSRTDVDYNRSHQQLAIELDTEHAGVSDPFNDIILVVQQNGRYDNEVALRHPLRVSGRRAYYEHLPQLVFPAGNEYRRFETVSTRYPGMGVDRIAYADPYYHFLLYPDKPRSAEPYLYDQTQHGSFLVREYNSTDSDIEADYAVVHFALDFPYQPGLAIYLDGDLVNRRFDSNSEMTYNPESGRYERALLLKQGAYNYQYLAVPGNSPRGVTAEVEGDRYQTVNKYDIKVYHRRPGERYDRLIGVATIFSGR